MVNVLETRLHSLWGCGLTWAQQCFELNANYYVYNCSANVNILPNNTKTKIQPRCMGMSLVLQVFVMNQSIGWFKIWHDDYDQKLRVHKKKNPERKHTIATHLIVAEKFLSNPQISFGFIPRGPQNVCIKYFANLPIERVQ